MRMKNLKKLIDLMNEAFGRLSNKLILFGKIKKSPDWDLKTPKIFLIISPFPL